jgi:hypothetical protein
MSVGILSSASSKAPSRRSNKKFERHNLLLTTAGGGPAMRKAVGIAFICLGMIGLAICGIVFFRLPLPAPEWLLRHLHAFSFLLAPVRAVLWSMASLTIGVLLLRHKE